MSLTDLYRREVETMTIREAKVERKKIQAYIDKGGFDTMMEAAFQYAKVKILDEKLGTETTQKPKPVKKRIWHFWK